MHYDTALRAYTAKRLEEIDSADILIGVPCYNNESTIVHEIQMITHGRAKHYGGRRSVIFIADGGSTDDTREVAKEFQIKPWQEKIVSIYRGPAGKGTALRSVFEAANRLEVAVCAMVDSDLRSITADWVKYLIDPVLEKGYQFVAPEYMRHKFDGTITNNIVYNLTRALSREAHPAAHRRRFCHLPGRSQILLRAGCVVDRGRIELARQIRRLQASKSARVSAAGADRQASRSSSGEPE